MQFRKVLIVIVQLIVLAIVDVALLFLFVFKGEYLIDGLTSVFIIIPTIALVNLVLGIVLYLIKQRRLAVLVFINIIVAPLVYNWVAIRRSEYLMGKKYQHYYFSYKGQKFDIELDKQSNRFDISETANPSNGLTLSFYGDYERKGDSIILIDSNRRPAIIGNKLIGYPTIKDTVLLKQDK